MIFTQQSHSAITSIRFAGVGKQKMQNRDAAFYRSKGELRPLDEALRRQHRLNNGSGGVHKLFPAPYRNKINKLYQENFETPEEMRDYFFDHDHYISRPTSPLHDQTQDVKLAQEIERQYQENSRRKRTQKLDHALLEVQASGKSLAVENILNIIKRNFASFISNLQKSHTKVVKYNNLRKMIGLSPIIQSNTTTLKKRERKVILARKLAKLKKAEPTLSQELREEHQKPSDQNQKFRSKSRKAINEKYKVNFRNKKEITAYFYEGFRFISPPSSPTKNKEVSLRRAKEIKKQYKTQNKACKNEKKLDLALFQEKGLTQEALINSVKENPQIFFSEQKSNTNKKRTYQAIIAMIERTFNAEEPSSESEEMSDYSSFESEKSNEDEVAFPKYIPASDSEQEDEIIEY